MVVVRPEIVGWCPADWLRSWPAVSCLYCPHSWGALPALGRTGTVQSTDTTWISHPTTITNTTTIATLLSSSLWLISNWCWGCWSCWCSWCWLIGWLVGWMGARPLMKVSSAAAASWLARELWPPVSAGVTPGDQVSNVTGCQWRLGPQASGTRHHAPPHQVPARPDRMSRWILLPGPGPLTSRQGSVLTWSSPRPTTLH